MTPLILINIVGRIVQISSGAASGFVSKCSKSVVDMLVDPGVTMDQVQQVIISPYLNIIEQNLPDDKRAAALEEAGLSDSGIVGAGYGLSKAALNAYTVEVARKHPNLLINSCTPGFIETDLTKPMAARNGSTPEQMGMKSVDHGATSAVYLTMADLRAEIPGYQSGWYFGSDAVRSPLHKYRSPGDPPYDGSYP